MLVRPSSATSRRPPTRRDCSLLQEQCQPGQDSRQAHETSSQSPPPSSAATRPPPEARSAWPRSRCGRPAETTTSRQPFPPRECHVCHALDVLLRRNLQEVRYVGDRALAGRVDQLGQAITCRREISSTAQAAKWPSRYLPHSPQSGSWRSGLRRRRCRP